MKNTIVTKVSKYISDIKAKLKALIFGDQSMVKIDPEATYFLDTQLLELRSKVVKRHPELVNSSPGAILLCALTEAWEYIDDKPFIVATILRRQFGSVGKGLLEVYKAKEAKIRSTATTLKENTSYDSSRTSAATYVGEHLCYALPVRINNLGFIMHDDPLSEASDMWVALALKDGLVEVPTIYELVDAFDINRDELNNWSPAKNRFCADDTITRNLLDLLLCVSSAYTRKDLYDGEELFVDNATTAAVIVTSHLYGLYEWMCNKSK